MWSTSEVNISSTKVYNLPRKTDMNDVDQTKVASAKPVRGDMLLADPKRMQLLAYLYKETADAFQ